MHDSDTILIFRYVHTIPQLIVYIRNFAVNCLLCSNDAMHNINIYITSFLCAQNIQCSNVHPTV